MPDSTSQEQRTIRHDLRALYETSQLLSSSLDISFILSNLLLTAMSRLFVTRGIALIYDADTSDYRVLSIKGIKELNEDEHISLGNLDTEDILKGDQVPDLLKGHGIVVVLPVSFGSRKIGLIGLGPKANGNPWDKIDEEFILSLVSISSTSVQNALMVEELQTANRDLDSKIQQLNTLFDLSQEFNSSIDRDYLVKLLTFALMGQMLVNKYLFVLKRGGPGDEQEDENEFQIVAAQGINRNQCQQDVLNKFCELTKELVLTKDECPPEWASLCDLGIALILPIKHQGEIQAVLCLGPKMTGADYQKGDFDLLYALGNLAFVSIQNTYLVEEQIEKERLEEEMRLARDIQERLLPSSVPSDASVEMAALALPSRHVGGDYYDLVLQSNGSILLAIADVTGKGVPAALLMANLQACLHTMVPMDLTMEEFISHMNRVICKNTGFDKFITAFTGLYEPQTKTLDYVNAGHNPPMLLRASGELELLEVGGLLLGVFEGAEYERGQVTLEPGDILAIFTDGVTEAMSPDGEEFHEDRLETILRDTQGETAQGILNAIRKEIISFTGSATQLSDDLTLIVLKAT